jgi:hypothetical protein
MVPRNVVAPLARKLLKMGASCVTALSSNRQLTSAAATAPAAWRSWPPSAAPHPFEQLGWAAPYAKAYILSLKAELAAPRLTPAYMGCMQFAGHTF